MQMSNVNENPMHEIERVPLGLHISVTSVHDIDTAKELATVCFDADLFIKAQPDGPRTQMDCGTVPTTRDEAVEELKAIFAESFVIGQIETNQEEMTTDDWGEGLLPNVYGGEVKFTVTMKVDMDLADFPFDVQTIALRFFQQYDRGYKLVSPSSFWAPGSDSLYAVPLSTTPSMLVSEEWNVHAPLLKHDHTLPQETISAYSQYSVQLKLSRKGEAYAGRFMSLMAALSLCGMAPLLIPDMEAGDVLSYEVGLLFTVVAFQLLVSSILPVSSTITVIDKYGVFLFGFIFVCMGAIAVQAHFKHDQARHFKLLAAWLLAGWMVFHVGFVWMVWSVISRKHEKIISHTQTAVGTSYIIRDGQERAIEAPKGTGSTRRRSSAARQKRVV